jgi:hypothetical protein
LEGHRLRVFENRVLRRMFGPKREKDGSWRKSHNYELHSLYSSPNIVRAIHSSRMRWVGHVARMGRGEVFTGFGSEARRDETTGKTYALLLLLLLLLSSSSSSSSSSSFAPHGA